ncbi:glycosyl transferase [Colwellia sp. 75C3]|uniref:glycosyltransferase n=1 Tax=Colwellia sp. 75C3 TaxID=888425 RepID=UPI000C32EA75|nr:glycosyltransferase [Colwellia sp. 75C3]PKG81743.1 glycosyl transferase [Colwellia sp. 75C3]
MAGKIAVAMSVYCKDEPSFLVQSIESLLDQTYKDFDIYIEVDGAVSDEHINILKKYSNFANIYVNYNNENKGLALRLNQIIHKVSNVGGYEYLARMDADDICTPERFAIQVEFLKHNRAISIVGSDVVEIDANGNKIFYKSMLSTHDEIFEHVIKRCPVNHPTVMFRASVFEDESITYNPRLLNTQDYYLWIDMLAKGHIFANISLPLVSFRVNDNFYSRRGVKKAINDTVSRFYAMKTLGIYNISNIQHVCLLFCLRLSPSFMKKYIYNKFR